MKKIIYLASLLFCCSSHNASAQTIDSLRKEIEQVVSGKKMFVGISIAAIEDKDTLSMNGNAHLPMQSVYKFHIALAVLNLVDNGKLSLQQQIHLQKSDLLPNTWSPLQKKYPEGNVNVSLGEILKYTVSESDNNGCDILLRLIGGTETANNYMHKIGIKNIAIKATEEEMHRDWNAQFTNWTTPIETTTLLQNFYNGNYLSAGSHEFLLKAMTETTTGENRIKGELPKGTTVAHKTGTSGTNKKGIAAATNDIGIITLPNGKHVAITVFVSNSKENGETNEKVIADISKLTWDYFLSKSN